MYSPAHFSTHAWSSSNNGTSNRNCTSQDPTSHIIPSFGCVRVFPQKTVHPPHKTRVAVELHVDGADEAPPCQIIYHVPLDTCSRRYLSARAGLRCSILTYCVNRESNMYRVCEGRNTSKYSKSWAQLAFGLQGADSETILCDPSNGSVDDETRKEKRHRVLCLMGLPSS